MRCGGGSPRVSTSPQKVGSFQASGVECSDDIPKGWSSKQNVLSFDRMSSRRGCAAPPRVVASFSKPPRAGPRSRVARTTTTTTTTTTGLCRGRRPTRPIVNADGTNRRHRGATERRRRERGTRRNTRGFCRAGLEAVGSVVASQSPGLGPALLVNSSVFLFGMPVLLKGLTGIATANAWFLGTVRFGGIVLYARDERESDDLKAQILLTCYVLKQPRDVPTLARRPRVRERQCTETRRFVVVSRNRLFSI